MFGRGSSSEAGGEGLAASKLVVEDDSEELDEIEAESEDELAASDDDCEITLGAEYSSSSSWLMPFGSDSSASEREITVPVIISWAGELCLSSSLIFTLSFAQMSDSSCLKEVVMRSSAKRKTWTYGSLQSSMVTHDTIENDLYCLYYAN